MQTTILRPRFYCLLLFALIPILLANTPTCRADTASGLVLGPDAKPVAGAGVTYYALADHVKAFDHATTSSSGQFTVNIDKAAGATGKVGECVVDAAGYAISYRWLTVGSDNTIHLSLPGTVSGVVNDASGAPVAGAVIQLNAIQDPKDSRASESGLLYTYPQSFKTDSHGRYNIARLPQGAVIRLGLLDPRFVSVYGDSVTVGQAAPPLIATLGAAIHGHVAYDGGQAAGAIRVYAQGVNPANGWSDTSTDATGNYTLTGLSSGSYNVCVDPPAKPDGDPPDWVGAAAAGVTAVEGQTAAAPDIVLTHGALVSGVVTDAKTGDPVAQVSIGSYGPARPATSAAILSATTDAQGRYRLRVAAGSNSVYVCGVPDGYLSDANASQRRISIAAGESQVQSFTVSHGLSVTGSAVDENGQPISGSIVSLQKDPQDWSDPIQPQGTSGSDGAFTVNSLQPGTYKILMDSQWAVVSPSSVTVPADSPIKLVLRRQILTSLVGKIVDATGAPVSGVRLTFLDFPPDSQEGSTITATSDRAGSFKLDQLVPDSKITSTEIIKPGYLLISGGNIAANNGGFTISDIILAPMNSTVSGVVRNALKAPVAGAWVVCAGEGGPPQPVRTDAAGRFHLTNLVAGPVDLYAAKGGYYAHEIAQAGPAKTIRITLDPASPAPKSADLHRGYQILRELQAAADGTSYYASSDIPLELAAYSPDLAVQWIQDGGGQLSDMNVLGILSARSQIDPEAAAHWAMTRLDNMQNKRLEGAAAAQVGLPLASVDRAKAMALYQLVKQNASVSTRDKADGSGVWTTMTLSSFAAAMSAPETQDLIKKSLALIAVADKDASSSRNTLLAAYPGFLAAGNVALARQIADTLPAADQARAYADIVTAAAPNDPDGALAAFRAMSGLTDGSGDFYYAKAAESAVAILVKKDPQGALTLARSLKTSDVGPSLLTIAADGLPLSQAAGVYREAISDSNSSNFSAFTPALVAAHGWVRDHALGLELFDKAAAKIDWAPKDPDQRPVQSVADFAFYYARIDPAYSRLLLEKRRADDAAHLGTNGDSGLFRDALAMTSIDVNRALAMAYAIKNTNLRLDVARKIAQYVIAPKSVRDTLRFDRWCATDSWIPGTPTSW